VKRRPSWVVLAPKRKTYADLADDWEVVRGTKDHDAIIEYEPGSAPAEILQLQIDRGEGWPAGRCHHVPVVESDDRDVVGDVAPGLAERIADASGDLVAAAGHCIEIGPASQQGGDRVSSPSLTPVAVLNGACDRGVE